MAEISEIISKEAIQSVKDADNAIVKFDGDIDKLIQTLKGLTGGGIGLKELNKTISESTIAAKKYNDVQNQSIAIQKKVEQANKALTTEGAKRAAAMDKEIAKEKELAAAIKLEVKSIEDAQRQNKALAEVRKKLDLSTDTGKKKLQEYNATMNKNTEFIRANATEAGKQAMNVGNYGSVWDGVKGKLLGVVAALGITGGIAGAMKVAQGIIASTGATADALEKTIGGLKEQAQFAARAFATFDFTNFIQGMKDANAEGRRYAETLDLIEDLQNANQLQKNDIERQILEQRIIAKNKSNEIGVREAAIKEIIRLEELKLSKTKEITQKGIENELTSSAFKSKQDQKDVADLINNYDKKVGAIKEGNKLIEDIESKTTKTVATRSGIYAEVVDVAARKKAYADLTAAQKESIKFAKIDNLLTDDKKKLIVAAFDADQKATNEMLSGKESLIRLENSLRSELIKTEKSGVDSIAKQIGAYAKLTQSISNMKENKLNMLAEGKTPSDAFLAELKKQEIQLYNISEAAKNAALNIVAMQTGKLTTGISLGGISKATSNTSLLTTSNWMDQGLTKGKKGPAMSDADKGAFAIDAAQITSDTTFQIIANAANAEFDLKMSLLEKEKNAKLSNTKLTEAQRAKINEEYARKEAKLKTEQAKKEKAAAIIQAIVNTALAISKANAILPPGNIAAMILAGIAGAAQIAVIASQPIPKFDKGTTNSPDTFIAGEKRPEFLRSPSGKLSLVDKPTLFQGMAGSTVISGEDTERIMKVAGRDGVAGINFAPNFDKLETSIVKAIQSQTSIHISGTTGKITERQGNYYKEYFNRKFKA